MRIILLVAMREYAENVKTKGFWIGVLLVPVVFAAIFLFTGKLASSAPVRHFILVDQSGMYGDAVDSAIRREHQRRILFEFVRYLQENRREDLPTGDGGAARTQVDEFVDDFDSDEVAALDQWLTSGGLAMALNMVAPYLKDNAPEFVEPRQQFVQVPLPPHIDSGAPPADIVEQLRPWLTGERRLEHNGERVPLFALIVIPQNVEQSIITPPFTPEQAEPDTPRGVQFWASNLTDTRLPNAIQDSINSSIRQQAFADRGISVQAVREVQRTRLPVSRLDPAKAEGDEEVSMADTFRQWAPIGFVYLIFISLMQSVQYLLSNTIEEKSNRIIEVLIASVYPE